jgi:DNA-binding transcriptional LysR family regulator
MDDPDLSDLSAFMAVTQVRSFRAAARVRGVSASALSEASGVLKRVPGSVC